MITITEFSNRKLPYGKKAEMTWEQFKDKIANPKYTDETVEEYKALTNEQRTDIKDIGGYVGGEFDNNKREKKFLINRTLITIDADDANKRDVEDFLAMNDYVFCAHTTHTSTNEQLRLRWIFPLSRPIEPREYKYIVRELSQLVGVDSLDESTDQPERLMFWPSCSLDADYQFWQGGEALVNPDDFIIPDGEDYSQEMVFDDSLQAEIKSHMTENGLVISEGSRNNMVFNYAANQRRMGLSDEMVYRTTMDFNESVCDPPLPPHEIDTIVRSVCRFPPGELVPLRLMDMETQYSDIGEWKQNEKKKNADIVDESLISLVARDVPDPKYLIDGVIPYGLTILCSAPKVGKSWMAYDFGISVAGGTKFLSKDTHSCGVLYLALEDNDSRLKSRAMKILNGRPLPNNLFLAQHAPSISEGLVAKLDSLLEKHKEMGDDIQLVIIDTLQMVRGTAGKNEGAYAFDYKELNALHDYVTDKNIAMLVLHHTNKGTLDNDDPFSLVSGTYGVNGAVDTMLILKKDHRKDPNVKLHMRGRETEEMHWVIHFDSLSCRWQYVGVEEDVESAEEEASFANNPIVKLILDKMEEAAELAESQIVDTPPEYIIWEASSEDIIAEAKRSYGMDDMPAITFGMNMKNHIAGPLLEKYGIDCEQQIKKNRRGYKFTKKFKD